MKQEIDVRIVKERRIGFFTALMMLGLVIWMWKFLLVAAVMFVVITVTFFSVVAYLERKHERMEILQRCDQQHAWVMKGDLRGTYGPWYAEQDYPTMVLCNSAPPRGPVPKRPEDRVRIVDGETVERRQ